MVPPIGVPQRRVFGRAIVDSGRVRAALAVDTIDGAEQVACLLVVCLLDLDLDAAPGFVPALLACMRDQPGGRMAAIRSAHRISEDDQVALLAAARALLDGG